MYMSRNLFSKPVIILRSMAPCYASAPCLLHPANIQCRLHFPCGAEFLVHWVHIVWKYPTVSKFTTLSLN